MLARRAFGSEPAAGTCAGRWRTTRARDRTHLRHVPRRDRGGRGRLRPGRRGRLRRRLLAALPPAQTTLEQVCALDTEIGQAFAAAAAQLLPADLVCSHGQTVYHWVDGRRALGTLQLGQPAWIAERTGLPVVADL